MNASTSSSSSSSSSSTIYEQCWIQAINPNFETDPQSVYTQIIGYIGTVLVIGHAIPASIDVWRLKNPDLVPDFSVVARIILSAFICWYGILTCQLPHFVSGVGSGIPLVLIIIGKIYFRHCNKLSAKQSPNNPSP